jgi:acyl carrier protein
METKDLEDRVFALVARSAPGKVAGLTLTLSLSLRRDLGLDSLALATLLFNFGEELGVDPSDLVERLGDDPLNTLADLVALGLKVAPGTEGPAA